MPVSQILRLNVRTYVDAAITDPVAWSVGLSVTLVSPTKTAEPIEMLFGLRTRLGPGNHALNGVQIPPIGRGNFTIQYNTKIYNAHM